ncbi:MAG: class II fumarate hydratase [Kangiellaceae bacterium]|nr:class II fumarate hydratase [Kangiellaceae bacterium]
MSYDEQYRAKVDALGQVKVPKDVYWGAQAQRTLNNFNIAQKDLIFPQNFIRCLAIIKLSAVRANLKLNLIEPSVAHPIIQASQEIIDGKMDDQFPVPVFQTGSGTQLNMNINEVIANRANQLLGASLGSKHPVHPNDHVNKGQSSNDVIPAAMHMALYLEIHNQLEPALNFILETLTLLQERFSGLFKCGRTHLQDAAPISYAQEIEGWKGQLQLCFQAVKYSKTSLQSLALGGTAVGTGLNTHCSFAQLSCENISEVTKLKFYPSDNNFFSLSSHEPILQQSSNFKLIATSLHKIANDIRYLSSGPNAGIGELLLPVNEPGSSAIPGKVNPTQIEALTMIVSQVFGNDHCISFACSQGQLQLNAYKPVIIYNALQSCKLLAEGINSFTRHCLSGLQVNLDRSQSHLEQNLMLVTALVPAIGYDAAVKIAQYAHQHKLTIKQAAKALNIIQIDQFDSLLNLSKMINPCDK